MSDTYQDMHCGDMGCCKGALWPDCKTTIAGDEPHHYDDAQSAASPHNFTD